MKQSLSKYAAFFGRSADVIREPNPDIPQSPFAYRFPPTKAGFLKRIMTPMHDMCVFITDGMSLREMDVPEDMKSIFPTRIELATYTKDAIIGQNDGQDIITGFLQALAITPFDMGIYFGPMQTLDLNETICQNSEMTGIFFAVPDGLDMNRLCKCTSSATLVVSVMPITTNEMNYAKEKGSEMLVELFEKNNIPNLFDPFRTGIV